MVLYYFTCCMYDRFWGLIFFSCWKLSPKWFWNIIYLSENLSQHINSVYQINENVYYAHKSNFIVASLFELQMSRRRISNFVFFSQISMTINIHEYKNLKKAFPNHTWNI